MTNTWFVCIDPADKGKATSYLDTVDFRIQVQPNDPNYQTLMSGGTINWNGQPLIRWQGPFATEAEAQAAQNPQQQSPNPLSDAKTAVGQAIDINGFLSLLTSKNTWLRVGEFVLGAMLILAGALHISGKSADLGDIAGLAKKAVIK